MGQLNSDKVVLCKLENDLRIAAKGRCFILQERVYDADSPVKYRWKDKFFYGWIGGLLRGYVLYSLKRFARNTSSEDIRKLMEQIERLDMDINNLDFSVAASRRDFVVDPVEVQVNEFIENDPIERAIAECNYAESCHGN